MINSQDIKKGTCIRLDGKLYFCVDFLHVKPETVCPVWRSRLMLKVRLMGTKNDIKWFGKILQRNSKIEVTEFSDLYPNKGTKKFYRAYVEVKKTNVAES